MSLLQIVVAEAASNEQAGWCKRIVTLTAAREAPPGHLEKQISPRLKSEFVQQAPLLQQSHINA